MKKCLLLADCDKEELYSLKKGIEDETNLKFELKIIEANIKLNKQRKGKLSEIKRYFWYFITPISLIKHANEYEIIVCWQQFYALIFSFYSNLFHKKKKTKLIACNYTYKRKEGLVSGLYRWFMGMCLKGEYLDYIHVLSNDYAKQIAQDFNFPRNRIVVSPFGIPDEYEKYKDLKTSDGYKDKGYFLSIGRSNRDFDFLIKAWEGINYKLVIASDKYNKETENKNIVIKHDIDADSQYNWILHSKASIIPIDDGRICSGDTVLLTTMSLKKILIVTKPSTLAEMYINDKENGLLVTKDTKKFKELINKVINGDFDYLQDASRQSFLDNFSRESMGRRIGGYINTLLNNK